MANEEHLAILKSGVKKWNEWRKASPRRKPDLSGANLIGAGLSGANLSRANLIKVNLSEANLSRTNFERANLGDADLSEADLSGANLSKAFLPRADLRGADLRGADISFADLSGTHFSKARLNRANLENAILIETNFNKTNLTNCHIYGISVWDIILDKDSRQSDLVITKSGEPIITVDNIEVAQFIYLILNNKKIRDVINTITSKAVLILGNFKKDRIKVLYAIKEELRTRGYLPILFDFEKPTDRDLSETVMTLAGMSKFIIADITEPRSTPFETELICPNFAIPFFPIIEEGKKPFLMFDDLHKKHQWALQAVSYKDLNELLSNFNAIIKKSEEKLLELRKMKLKGPDPPIPIRLLNQ